MTTRAFQTEDFIASHYPADQLVLAGPGRRLGAYAVMLVVWFGIAVVVPTTSVLPGGSWGLAYLGYLVWFIIAANDGRTPGHQLLGMYIIKADGTRAGGGDVWLRELVFKGIVLVLLSVFTLGIFWLIAALWCLWDRDNQCIWDKMGGTYVAWSPAGFKPLTAQELRTRAPASQQPPPSPRAATGVSTSEQLRELARLHGEGIINVDEYETRRERLVREL